MITYAHPHRDARRCSDTELSARLDRIHVYERLTAAALVREAQRRGLA